MSLPEVLRFECIDRYGRRDAMTASTPCYYRKVAKRPPQAGEWYVSGAQPMAYYARNDLTSEYLVVVPTHVAVARNDYARGPAIAPGNAISESR